MTATMIDPKDVQIIYKNLKIFDARVQVKLQDVCNNHAKAIQRGAKARVSSRGIRRNAGGRKLDIKSRIRVQKAKFVRGKTAAKIISAAPHSHLVEYGTAPHILNYSGKKPLRVVDQDVMRFVSRSIRHPGAKKKPFMVPAYMAERNNFLREVAQIVHDECEAVKAE